MNKLTFGLITIWGFLALSGMVWANPGLLPAHPGYPMSAAKSPVTGQPVANDPGKVPPSVEESLKQASAFHDAHAVNPKNEVRPNIVHANTNERMDDERKN